MTHYLKTAFWVFSILFITIFTLTLLNILYSGFSDKIAKSDVAIIFGSKVNEDGTPSNRLVARLNTGVELYKEKLVRNIIVSGGIGKEGVDEAIIMKDYLLNLQIPRTAIIVDSEGVTTEATAKNSTELMQEHGFKSAIIVSQYFHIKRAKLALQRCGISPIYNIHANYFEFRDIYSAAREVIGYYSYLLINRNC